MNAGPDIAPNMAIARAYTIIGTIYCAISSVVFYTVAEHAFLAAVHVAAFFAVCCYYVVVRRTADMKKANSIILVTGTVVVLSLFATGGWAGTGYFWPFAYLPFVFFLSGKERITVWVLLLIAGLVGISVLGLLHVLALPYTPVLLLNYFAALAIFVTCIFLFQNATIRYQEFLSQSKATELQHLNGTLEQKVTERTHQLELSNQELEAFSYSVSHDLRTPLRAISGYAAMLHEDHHTALDADGKRLIGNIQGNAKRMGLLIDDLLAFSKLGRKEVQKTRVDMNAITQSVVEELSRSAHPGQEINISPLHPAMADSALIRLVMVNFISNAVKYSSTAPRALIEIWSVDTPETVTYAVRDNGTGFDMQYAHKLFGVFQRLHTQDEFEGTGVGLAIVKRIIDKHGGMVHAEGKPGKGATFYFSLPKT